MKSCLAYSLMIMSTCICACSASKSNEFSFVKNSSWYQDYSTRLVRRGGKKSRKGPSSNVQKHKSAADTVGRSKKSVNLAQQAKLSAPGLPTTPTSPGGMPSEKQQQSPKSPEGIPTGTQTRSPRFKPQRPQETIEQKQSASLAPGQERVPFVSQQPGSARRKHVASPPILPKSAIQPPRQREPSKQRIRTPSPPSAEQSRSISPIIFTTTSGSPSSSSRWSSARSSSRGSSSTSSAKSSPLSASPASPASSRHISPVEQRGRSPVRPFVSQIANRNTEGLTFGQLWHQESAATKALFGVIPPPQPQPKLDMDKVRKSAEAWRRHLEDTFPAQPAQAVSATQRQRPLANTISAATLDKWDPHAESRVDRSSPSPRQSTRPFADVLEKTSLAQAASRQRSSPVRIPEAEGKLSGAGRAMSPSGGASSSRHASPADSKTSSPKRSGSLERIPALQNAPALHESSSTTSSTSSIAPAPHSPPGPSRNLRTAWDVPTGSGSLQESRNIITGLKSKAGQKPDTSVAGRKNRALAASAMRHAEDLKQKAKDARWVAAHTRKGALDALASGDTKRYEEIDRFIDATKANREIGWDYSRAEGVSAATLVEVRRFGDAAKALQRADRAYMRQSLNYNYGAAVDNKWHHAITKDLEERFPGSPARRRKAESKQWYRTAAENYHRRYRDYKQVREEFSGSSSDESEKSTFKDIMGSRDVSPRARSPIRGPVTSESAEESLGRAFGMTRPITTPEGSKVWNSDGGK